MNRDEKLISFFVVFFFIGTLFAGIRVLRPRSRRISKSLPVSPTVFEIKRQSSWNSTFTSSKYLQLMIREMYFLSLAGKRSCLRIEIRILSKFIATTFFFFLNSLILINLFVAKLCHFIRLFRMLHLSKSCYFFVNVYIYIYVDKRMGIWNIAKNSRLYFATNFLKLFTYFALLKYLICANLVSSSPFFSLIVDTLPEHHDYLMFASVAFNQLLPYRLKIQSCTNL